MVVLVQNKVSGTKNPITLPLKLQMHVYLCTLAILQWYTGVLIKVSEDYFTTNYKAI